VVLLCACFALLTAIFPIARAFYRVEVDYSEGWNVYNAQTLANHQLLYPTRYGWTTVNYPMLSFAILAQLHRFTHDYLFTARALSLIALAATCLLVGAIVRRLGASRQVAVLTAFYCLALFATDADVYVATDDPQMLAQVFFLSGLLLYLWRRASPSALAASALLFVLGGSIKHNPIDFPLAVLIDLALIAPRRAVWFGLCCAGFASASIALNIHFGGPYFITEVLLPRSWSLAKAADNLQVVLGPLLLPFLAAAYTAFMLRNDQYRRIASILLITSLLVGGFFGGGVGVSINSLFSALLATAILTSLFWERLWNLQWQRKIPIKRPATLLWAPALFFTWMLIPWMLVPAIRSGFDRNQWDPVRRLSQTIAAEKRFDQETAALRRVPGPAICESLLRCYFAGKPYVFDPFNATRLIQFSKIDPAPLVEDLRRRRYAAVQLDLPIRREKNTERFDPAIVAAIEQNYAPALVNQDGEIYVPRAAPQGPLTATLSPCPQTISRNSTSNAQRFRCPSP
jgi:hypothetical protein